MTAGVQVLYFERGFSVPVFVVVGVVTAVVDVDLFLNAKYHTKKPMIPSNTTVSVSWHPYKVAMLYFRA